MGIFDFLKKKKPNSDEIPSEEQKLFGETALRIIQPTVEKFGFSIHNTQIKKYSTRIVWRKDDLYIKIQGTTYPTDYPYYFCITLGEGNSDNFFEYDWNCVALWRLKSKITGKDCKENKFPYGEFEVEKSISQENDDLLKYGSDFMNANLTLFYECRLEQNRNREPYKIYTPDKNGTYQVQNELKSVDQKKKYS